MVVIELVDLVTTGDDRHVPAQQIDEHALARLEHRRQRAVLRWTRPRFEPLQHETILHASRNCAREGSGRTISPGYPQKWVYQRRKMSVKLIVPSNRVRIRSDVRLSNP